LAGSNSFPSRLSAIPRDAQMPYSSRPRQWGHRVLKAFASAMAAGSNQLCSITSAPSRIPVLRSVYFPGARLLTRERNNRQHS